MGTAPHPIIFVNGERAPAGGACVSALDRGFTLADGLFETMRAYDGVVFRLDRHLARLHQAARVLALPLAGRVGSVVGTAVEDAMRAAAAAGLTDASVRLTVSRGTAGPGGGGPGLAPPERAEPTVVVAVHPLPAWPPSLYAAGLSACVASGRRNERAMSAGLKTLAYTDSVMALAEARAHGADDALFLDTAGHVSEAAASNVFCYARGCLVTPPVSCAALPGITRAAVMELAASLGIGATERVLEPPELAAADEAFLTSSVREVVPLVRLDGRVIGGGAVGPVTTRLIAAYRELVWRECGGGDARREPSRGRPS